MSCVWPRAARTTSIARTRRNVRAVANWANGVVALFQTQKPGDIRNNVDIELTRPAIVRGQVLNRCGKPVMHREVRATPADRREDWFTTLRRSATRTVDSS